MNGKILEKVLIDIVDVLDDLMRFVPDQEQAPISDKLFDIQANIQYLEVTQ